MYDRRNKDCMYDKGNERPKQDISSLIRRFQLQYCTQIGGHLIDESYD